MSDLYSFDLSEGLESDRCPLCHALDVYMQRWLHSFWREGRRQPIARERFYAGGGLCGRHVWLGKPDVEHASAVADVYGQLVSRDIAALDAALAKRARRREPERHLRRPADCSACSEEADAIGRKVQFFVELLATNAGRHRYERSRGVCRAHLLALFEAVDDPLACFLLEDWRRRLVDLRDRLEHLDRTRDHRFSAERTGDDGRACGDVIRRYVGGEG